MNRREFIRVVFLALAFLAASGEVCAVETGSKIKTVHSGFAELTCGDAKAELDRAKAYWPIVRADSRIGFGSSNQYYYVPRDVLEKVISCRMILDRL